MIGKPDWFTNRRYIGIGIRPKTWQGWVYVLIVVALVVFIRWQPFWEWTVQTRYMLTITWAVVVVLDVIHIMIILNRKKG